MTIYVTNKLQVTPAAASGEQPITNTYTWLRSGSPISGATGDTYLATDADIGYSLSVIQKAMNVAGFAKATSTTVGPVVEYSPLALFNASEVGVWYDPSDLTTLFQDSAGTTPVTAVEQPVGLMLDKSQGLTLGPELVTNGDFSDGTTGWGAYGAQSAISASSGKLRITQVSGGSGAIAYQAISTVVGRTYKLSVDFVTDASTGNSFINVGTTIASIVNGQINVGSVLKTYVLHFVATQTTSYISLTNSSTALINDYSEWDNISVKELPGNHAYQTTSTSRPVLSARVNFLTKTEQFDDVYWSKVNATIVSNAVIAPDGTMTGDKLVISNGVPAGGATNDGVYRIETINSNTYTWAIYAKAAEFSTLRVRESVSSGAFLDIDLVTGAITNGNATQFVSPLSQSVGNGWWRVSWSSPSGVTAAFKYILRAASTGDGTSGIYIWGASLVPADQASLPYQRVNTATDYDTVGFKPYLKFDGVDDWMVTPTITPGIDKAQVFAGVRKLSDADIDVLAEIGPSNVTSNGSWGLQTVGIVPDQPAFSSRGTIRAPSFAVWGVSPRTGVLTGTGDISGDLAALRVNGNQIAQSTADQGTGNYLAYPLYIGRRAGTQYPFNGHIYSLIVRFGANLDTTTIAQTESWVNGKTLAY